MKYMGSKSRIAKHLVPIIQREIDDNNIHYYLEPFCGSCSIIDKICCDRKFAYDINKYLIYLLIHVKSGGELPEMIDKGLYDELRAAWYEDNKEQKYPDWLIGAGMFLASYNGRGYSGGYAKPGYEQTTKGRRYRDYYQEAKDNLIDQIQKPLFRDIMFGISNYKNLDHLDNYVIYCDPPYKGKKQYEYSKGFDYDEFWDKMREWSKNNIVLISELEAPDDFECIWQQEVSRSIKATDKSKATEKLYRYIDKIKTQ